MIAYLPQAMLATAPPHESAIDAGAVRAPGRPRPVDAKLAMTSRELRGLVLDRRPRRKQF
jgi:hypothetical protein